ncbi:uncharacterized protein LY89DRAFT_708353 [Mollisia scopiformis]|uniref:Uncharacterized protein n=1 Tax=Mollisia scopiformis TaxID=149040 RepID=A0A194X473_MOLSC|nr:uncharacterized protein LY89DRAFT_708353 [Mollisia scopiformis]KUJ14617.1 hypothetical protein LY89DRAFT_708353 [Mollisia scopiformis]
MASITTLSSYNWIEAPKATPTIAVPGSPALWSAPGVSRRLKKDSGLVYIAQNAARHPESPLEPPFRALYVTNPSFDIPFTMTIEVTQNTAIFCRDEIKTLEYIGPQDFRGFGHEFDSTGHHRIISYRFSDLNLIVRHETDGYVDTGTRASSSKAKSQSQDDLSSTLGALSLSPANSSPGLVVPLELTLEIKTRVSHKSLDIQELVRAYHQNGTFQRPVVEDVAAVIKIWEERKQNELRILAALIRKIINLVKECGGNAILKYNTEGDKLVVCKVERKEMLPKDLYSKWDGAPNLGAEIDTRNDGLLGPKIAQTRRESISTMRTTGDDLKATIRIGDMDYSVHMVSKMPYLASFVRLQKVTQPEATVFIHEPINLFDIALKGVESGYRQCYRSLPTNLSQYRTLFATYKFLNVDILSGLSIDEVIANLKGLARDTAFQLLYLILYAQFGDETKDSMKLSNAVMFIVSHPGTFKSRTKRVIRLAYEERFSPTTKQRARLDEWEKGENADAKTDATTEEEPYYYFDSDDSFF